MKRGSGVCDRVAYFFFCFVCLFWARGDRTERPDAKQEKVMNARNILFQVTTPMLCVRVLHRTVDRRCVHDRFYNPQVHVGGAGRGGAFAGHSCMHVWAGKKLRKTAYAGKIGARGGHELTSDHQECSPILRRFGFPGAAATSCPRSNRSFNTSSEYGVLLSYSSTSKPQPRSSSRVTSFKFPALHEM